MTYLIVKYISGDQIYTPICFNSLSFGRELPLWREMPTHNHLLVWTWSCFLQQEWVGSATPTHFPQPIHMTNCFHLLDVRTASANWPTWGPTYELGFIRTVILAEAWTCQINSWLISLKFIILKLSCFSTTTKKLNTMLKIGKSEHSFRLKNIL